MPYSMGCLFVEAYEVSGSKELGNAQLAGTPITYSSPGSAGWSGPNAVLYDQSGVDMGVGSGTLTPVFILSGSGITGTVSIDMLTLLSLKNAALPAKRQAYSKIWDAFTGNGHIVLTVMTSVGAQPIRIELRALKTANYTLTVSTRLAAPDFPGGVSTPSFNFTGESASNFTAEFVVPGNANLVTASFSPDSFSIPSGTLPSTGTYGSSQLALTRAFSTDSDGNPINTYSVPSNLPSTLQVV